MDGSVQCQILCFGENVYSEAMRNRPNVHVVKLSQIKTRKHIFFWKVLCQYPADAIVLVKGIFEPYSLSAYVAARMSRTGRLIGLEHNIPNAVPDRVNEIRLIGSDPSSCSKQLEPDGWCPDLGKSEVHTELITQIALRMISILRREGRD
jgi:hypothetical protein